MSSNGFFTGNTFLVLGLLTASWLHAQETSDRPLNDNRTTFETLENKTLNVDFSNTRLADVLSDLEQKLNVTFLIDHSAEDNNLDAETVITLSTADGLRASTVLHMILQPHFCTWTIQDGVVSIISTDQATANESLMLMTFECGDLTKKIRPCKTISQTHWDRLGNPQMGMFGNAGGFFSVRSDSNLNQKQESAPTPESVDASTDPKDGSETTEQLLSPMQQLEILINETVDPDSWRKNGGPGSSMYINHVLVVRQTQSNIRLIHQLLDQLRTVNLEQ